MIKIIISCSSTISYVEVACSKHTHLSFVYLPTAGSKQRRSRGQTSFDITDCLSHKEKILQPDSSTLNIVFFLFCCVFFFFLEPTSCLHLKHEKSVEVFKVSFRSGFSAPSASPAAEIWREISSGFSWYPHPSTYDSIRLLASWWQPWFWSIAKAHCPSKNSPI